IDCLLPPGLRACVGGYVIGGVASDVCEKIPCRAGLFAQVVKSRYRILGIAKGVLKKPACLGLRSNFCDWTFVRPIEPCAQPILLVSDPLAEHPFAVLQQKMLLLASRIRV